MSTAGAYSQSSPPGDQELADLYNQVLIGFAEESPTSEHSSHKLPSPGDRDLYAADRGDSARSMHSIAARSPNVNPVQCTYHSLSVHPETHGRCMTVV